MALKAILDTRFFFAYFNPTSKRQSEWCKSIVHKAMESDSLLLASTITISELYESMGRLVGKDVVKIRIASIKAKNINFVPVDESIAAQAGGIRLANPHVPVADAIITATAEIFTNSLVLTDDPHFRKINGIKTQWIE